MERIVKGEADEDGMFWLSQINAPKYVIDLVVLDQLHLTVEEQTETITLDGKTYNAVVVPLIDLGFKGEDMVNDAILSAMGYGSRVKGVSKAHQD